VQGDTLETEHVVSVRRDLDFEEGSLFLGPLRIIFGIFVELDAEVEAEILEFVGREPGDGG
jgi:hypothetical protein